MDVINNKVKKAEPGPIPIGEALDVDPDPAMERCDWIWKVRSKCKYGSLYNAVNETLASTTDLTTVDTKCHLLSTTVLIIIIINRIWLFFRDI
jgi:hypothetical protein